MHFSRTALFAALGASATGAAAQPDAWELLRGVTAEEVMTDTSYTVRKSFPAAFSSTIPAFQITGYAVPMQYGEATRDIMLVSDMGFCPYCGDPAHGVALQVTLAEPMTFADDSTRLQLRGTLLRVDDPETFQAAVLNDAEVLR